MFRRVELALSTSTTREGPPSKPSASKKTSCLEPPHECVATKATMAATPYRARARAGSETNDSNIEIEYKRHETIVMLFRWCLVRVRVFPFELVLSRSSLARSFVGAVRPPARPAAAFLRSFLPPSRPASRWRLNAVLRATNLAAHLRLERIYLPSSNATLSIRGREAGIALLFTAVSFYATTNRQLTEEHMEARRRRRTPAPRRALTGITLPFHRRFTQGTSSPVRGDRTFSVRWLRKNTETEVDHLSEKESGRLSISLGKDLKNSWNNNENSGHLLAFS